MITLSLIKQDYLLHVLDLTDLGWMGWVDGIILRLFGSDRYVGAMVLHQKRVSVSLSAQQNLSTALNFYLSGSDPISF